MNLMKLPVALPGMICKRGLHIAPWTGDAGEIVLLAIMSNRHLASAPLEIPWGGDSVTMAEELQAVLDAKDPPYLKLI